MRSYLFRTIGKALSFIGMTILFITILAICSVFFNGINLQLEVSLMLVEFAFLGTSLVAIGGIIYRQFIEREPFLAKDGGPIHSVRNWMEKSEPELFLTSCGLVASVNQESVSTAHVGYRIIPAKQATCIDCIQREGKEVLDAHFLRRE